MGGTMSPNRDPALLSAIAEAVEDTPLESYEDSTWNSWDNPTETSESDETPTPAAAPGESQSQTAEGSSEETTPEAPVVQEDEVPLDFWGVDLSDLSAEKRAEVIAHFEQQEGTIHKLQQRLAAEAKPTESEPEVDAELSDEDILRGLGINPDEYTDPSVTAPLIRMAKATMALEDRVEELNQREQTREVANAWNSSLDQLEETYGKLPGSRVQVLQYAVDEGIVSPEALYFRLTAPVRKEVEAAAQEARRTALKRETQGGVKPRSGGGEPIPVTKGMSMREAVEKAARAAEKETKLRWRDAIRGRVTEVSEQ